MAHFDLGLALASLGRWDDGIAELEEALRVDDGFEPAKQALEAVKAERIFLRLREVIDKRARCGYGCGHSLTSKTLKSGDPEVFEEPLVRFLLVEVPVIIKRHVIFLQDL